MTKIKYIVGDLFAAIADNPKPIVIPHIVNSIGAFGAGFVVPLGKRFPKAKEKYLEWSKRDWKATGIPFKLGETQYVRINDRITVMNMIGQEGTGLGIDGRPPIRYSALVRCMQNVAGVAKALDAEIHAPAFGSGLARGCWTFVEELIKECWCDWNIPVTIYSLEAIQPTVETIELNTDDVGDFSSIVDPNAGLLEI